MSHYITRYLAGETQQVWDEISQLNYPNLSSGVQTDIQSVCEETIRRVRHNAEMLISALASIGFEFGLYPDGEKLHAFSVPLEEPAPDIERKIIELESKV